MIIKSISISRINPAPYNPRKDLKPDDRQFQQLVRSMDEFGFVEPLIWNAQTGNLVGGHQRFKVLLAQGAQQVQVSIVDLPPAKEKALNIALNKISGEWDNDKLAELLDELIKSPEIELDAMGFEMPEAEQLIADILGDSDDPFAAAGELADNRPATKKTTAPKDLIRNDDLTPKRYASWFGKVTVCLGEALVPGAPYYIWNAHKNFGLMHDLLAAHNFKVASVITWAKESFCPGFGDYNEQLEYCLYGWKGGARHFWYGPKNASTLWQVRRDRTDLYRHPTQKALELAERAVRNSSRKNDIVFDPFLGSGTTLIAAARLGRRCFGLEIEPRYCDIIVRRYIALAGHDAVAPDLLDRYCREEVTI